MTQAPKSMMEILEVSFGWQGGTRNVEDMRGRERGEERSREERENEKDKG